MASVSLSMKMVFVTGFEIVGCILIALCFMRGFLAYLGNLLDLVIYHLHVKNSAELSPETEEAIEEIVVQDQQAKAEPRRSSSPLKLLLMWATCLGLASTIFHLVR
jgi:hypothetical protein